MNSQSAKTSSPFEEITKTLREDFPYYTGWRFIQKKGGITHYCALAYLEKKKGYADWRIRFNLIDNIVEKYGFTHDEAITEKLCPIDGCRHAGPLENLIGHLNVKHKLSAMEMADAVEKIGYDKRELPPLWKRIVMQITFR